VSKVTEILIYEEEDHDEMVVRSPARVKEADQEEVLVEAAAPDDQCAGEEEGVNKTGLSVGNLRVNGVGALCSFGVAAATFFIFLLGGKQQQKRQDHKIHRQMYAGDEVRGSSLMPCSNSAFLTPAIKTFLKACMFLD
jgi:hypothetical protein